MEMFKSPRKSNGDFRDWFPKNSWLAFWYEAAVVTNNGMWGGGLCQNPIEGLVA